MPPSQEEYEAWKRKHQAGPPSTPRVAVRSAAKGAIGIPDMFLGAPANLFNLASAGVGYAAGELGRPDITAKMPILGPEFTQPIRSGLEAAGAFPPELEPQTPAQRIIGRSVELGTGFAVAPGPTLTNLSTGLLSGLLGGVTKEVTGSEAAATGVSLLTPLAQHALARQPHPTIKPSKQAVLAEGQREGYVVPPSQAASTVVRRRLEDVAGKAATKQDAALRNQEVTNRLAARAIGLPDDTMLTRGTLENVRKQAGRVYDRVDQLRPPADMPWFRRFHERNLGEQLQQARADANAWYRSHDVPPYHPSALKKAQRYEALANSLEDDIHRIAKASGDPTLMQDLRGARQLMAKTFDIERALNPATGDVSAPMFARMLARKHPFSGELLKIARFASAFPKVMREAVQVEAPGVSATSAGLSAALGTIGVSATKSPIGLLPAGLPLLRGPARQYLLSRGMQNRLLRPSPRLSETMMRSTLAGAMPQQSSQ